MTAKSAMPDLIVTGVRDWNIDQDPTLIVDYTQRDLLIANIAKDPIKYITARAELFMACSAPIERTAIANQTWAAIASAVRDNSRIVPAIRQWCGQNSEIVPSQLINVIKLAIGELRMDRQTDR